MSALDRKLENKFIIVPIYEVIFMKLIYRHYNWYIYVDIQLNGRGADVSHAVITVLNVTELIKITYNRIFLLPRNKALFLQFFKIDSGLRQRR
ncbi:MAG: hypothetical protein V6014_00615 [Candidatus Dasytiphilus stammeri]